MDVGYVPFAVAFVAVLAAAIGGVLWMRAGSRRDRPYAVAVTVMAFAVIVFAVVVLAMALVYASAMEHFN
jgi:ABC-type spermidine/putrescine transport system permease subunit II